MLKDIRKKVIALSISMILLIIIFLSNSFISPPKNFASENQDIFDIQEPTTLPDIDTPNNNQGENNSTQNNNTLIIPEKFRTALQAYNYATDYLNNSIGVYASIYGTVDAAVATQTIKGVKIIDKDGNLYYESASKKTSSIGVNFAEKSYIPHNEEIIYYSTTNSVNEDMTANYNGKPKTYNFEDYVKEYYILPTERNFIINKDSITNSRIRYSNTDNRYYGSFTLNQNAVTHYQYKLQKSSGSSTLPEFTSISMEFILDKYGRFLSITTSDTCKATIFISVNISTTVREVFRSYNDTSLIIEGEGLC